MKNFAVRDKAVAVVNEVLSLTGEQYLHQQIDEPIENAYATFRFDKTAPVTHKNFILVTGRLVHRIYKHGLLMKRILSRSYACREALAFMEKGYENQGARGYDAAYLDASNPDGLEFVLTWTAEFMAARERSRHIKWVYASRIDPYDWETNCMMVEILIEQWNAFLPSRLLACTPAQLVSCLPELFKNISVANSEVRKNLSGGSDFYTSETAGDILPLPQ